MGNEVVSMTLRQLIQSTNWFKLLPPKVKPIDDNEMLNEDEKMKTCN